MFGIGWGEMMVIGLVALLVVGPEKLPEMAKTIGHFYGQLRQAANEAGAALSAEVDMIKTETRLDPKKDLTPSALVHPSLEEIRQATAEVLTGSPAESAPAPIAPLPVTAEPLAAPEFTAPTPSPSSPDPVNHARVERENA